MNAVFDLPIQTETLSIDELSQITGCCRKNDQIKWLTSNSWKFYKNKAGEPIVGRFYARLKLTGINPASINSTQPGWAPDFSSIK